MSGLQKEKLMMIWGLKASVQNSCDPEETYSNFHSYKGRTMSTDCITNIPIKSSTKGSEGEIKRFQCKRNSADIV